MTIDGTTRTQKPTSVPARPCTTYRLFDIGHALCVLTSPGEQDQERPRVAVWPAVKLGSDFYVDSRPATVTDASMSLN